MNCSTSRIDIEGQYAIRKYPLQTRHKNIIVDDDRVKSTLSVGTTKQAYLSHPFDPPLIDPTFSNASPGTVNLRQGTIATSTLNSVRLSNLDWLHVDICFP